MHFIGTYVWWHRAAFFSEVVACYICGEACDPPPIEDIADPDVQEKLQQVYIHIHIISSYGQCSTHPSDS